MKSTFYYESKKLDGDSLCSGSYDGHFEMKSADPLRQDTRRYLETNVQLHFYSNDGGLPNELDRYVNGHGQNEFGKFNLSGLCKSSGHIEVTKHYFSGGTEQPPCKICCKKKEQENLFLWPSAPQKKPSMQEQKMNADNDNDNDEEDEDDEEEEEVCALCRESPEACDQCVSEKVDRLQEQLSTVYAEMIELLEDQPMGNIFDANMGLDKSGFVMDSTTCGQPDGAYHVCHNLDGDSHYCSMDEWNDCVPEWEELYSTYLEIQEQAEEMNITLDFGKEAVAATAKELTEEQKEECQEQLQVRLSEVYSSMVEVLEGTNIGEYDPSEPLDESGVSLLIAGGRETVHFDLDGEDDLYGFGGINQGHSEWEALYSEYKAVCTEAEQIGVEVEFCGE